MTREQIEDIIERAEHSTRQVFIMLGVIIVSILPPKCLCRLIPFTIKMAYGMIRVYHLHIPFYFQGHLLNILTQIYFPSLSFPLPFQLPASFQPIHFLLQESKAERSAIRNLRKHSVNHVANFVNQFRIGAIRS